MDKLILFLVIMLILQCFLHWCSPDEGNRTLESFRRWNEENRSLKAKWDKGKKAFELSFTGRRNEDNTTFIFRHTYGKHKPFRIHLAADDKYLLAVVNNSLVLKIPDTTEDPTIMDNYNFNQTRVSNVLAENPTGVVVLQVIAPKALVEKHIKSDENGLVSLGRKYDCGCWIRIKNTGAGN